MKRRTDIIMHLALKIPRNITDCNEHDTNMNSTSTTNDNNNSKASESVSEVLVDKNSEFTEYSEKEHKETSDEACKILTIGNDKIMEVEDNTGPIVIEVPASSNQDEDRIYIGNEPLLILNYELDGNSAIIEQDIGNVLLSPIPENDTSLEIARSPDVAQADLCKVLPNEFNNVADDFEGMISNDIFLNDTNNNSNQSVDQTAQENHGVVSDIEINDESRVVVTKHNRQREKQKKDRGLEYRKRNGDICDKKKFVQLLQCCSKKCYQKIPTADQKSVFEDFYMTGDQKKQDQVIADRLELNEPKPRRVRLDKNKKIKEVVRVRTVNVNYKLKGIFVCKKMFCNAFGISKAKVNIIVAKKRFCTSTLIQTDQRGKKTPHNSRPDEHEQVKSHIESFPKYESHYSRRHSAKLYISAQLNVTKMYELYSEKRKQEGGKPFASRSYEKVFKSLGYKTKSPSIDTCKTCDKLSTGISNAKDSQEKEELENEKTLHLEKADRGYSEKKSDKVQSREENSSSKMICFDLQQCLPTPDLGSNIVYYKRQLWTYNLTIRDCTDNTSHCYMWHEGVAMRGSDEIASCLLHFLSNIPSTVKNIIAYSDSCPGQNKNINVAAALSHFVSSSETVVSVEHTFLEPGHTRMECDADHARIERSKKTSTYQVRVPEDWYQLVRTVRGKKPFVVKEMDATEFFEFSKLIGSSLMKKKKNTDGNPINWHSIRWLKYEKDFGLIQYKTNLNQDEPFSSMDLKKVRRGRRSTVVLEKKYSGPLPISSKKKQDLISMLNLINPMYHSFYHGLKANKESRDVGDWAESSDEEEN